MNLTDGDFLKPYILSHPKTRVALKNDNITLTCQAVSTEDSGTVFIWKRDNVVSLQLMVDLRYCCFINIGCILFFKDFDVKLN